MPDLIRVENVSKAFAGVPALRSASLSISHGEIHALVGENGAGKSTLIKILAGALPADELTVSIDESRVQIRSPNDAIAFGLRFIHQELDTFPALSVAENIFVGREYPQRLGVFVDWASLKARASDALGLLGIGHVDPSEKMTRLGRGDQMLVRLSAAFLDQGGKQARLYVMDEPTASLNSEEADRLFAVLTEIKRSGRSVLYVTHRLDEVMEHCDRVTVMRGGSTVSTQMTAETSASTIIKNMIGRPIEEAYPPRTKSISPETSLQCHNLTGNKVGPVTFEVKKGEIVGLAGLSGAGQSDVLSLLTAAFRRSGTITLLGNELKHNHPLGAWKNQIAAVPQERRTDGLLLNRSIADNVTLPHLQHYSHGGVFLNRSIEDKAVADAGKQVRLKSQGVQQHSYKLSGGNQQKVIFARALLERPELLLLDEPTRGVDIGAKFDIYSLIREVSATGTSVLIASTDFPELLGLCDRILVMRDGKISVALDTDGLTEESLLTHCFGAAQSATASPGARPT